jgi:hypothetical protein
MHMSCLLFADDLVLFSESKSGIQIALNRLNEYTTLWALEVNVSKTKMMYIGPKRASNCINPVHFNGHSISEVESFTYLGLLYSNDGSVKKTKSELYNKGLKAYFKLSRSIGTKVKMGTMLTPI